MATAILLYGRQARKQSFIQELCALEMWKSGAEQKLFKCFQRLGICKGSKGAKASVDKLCGEFDVEIKTWKKELEEDASKRPTGEMLMNEHPVQHDSPDTLLMMPENINTSREPGQTMMDGAGDREQPGTESQSSMKMDNAGDTHEIESESPMPTGIANLDVEREDCALYVDHVPTDNIHSPADTYSPPMDLSPSSDRQWIRNPSVISTPSDISLLPADTYSPPMDVSPSSDRQRIRNPSVISTPSDISLLPADTYSPPMDLSPSSDRQWIRYPSAISTPSDISLLLEPEYPIPNFEEEKERFENPGFCLVWDNVQLLSTTRHHASNKNKMRMWALAYAAQNRIGFNHETSEETMRAKDIPLYLLLPTRDDYTLLKHRMEVIVMRILKSHLDLLKECVVPEHVHHQFSQESAEKSRIINLGVIEADPSSVQGTITIMEHLQQYVPSIGNKLHKIPTHGDGLSIERMRDSKIVRAPSETAIDRLEGLEPVPQEWHKRALVMQDTFNNFYHPNSGANRGTLFHIRNAFGYRNVTKEVIKSFNYNADLLEFTTRGLTSLLAKQLIEDIIQNHENLDMNTILELLASKVVDTVWMEVPQESVDAVIDAEDEDDDDDEEEYYEYCFCKEEREAQMIKCSNNRCCNGSWFHADCVRVDNTDGYADRDWWCSPECQDSRASIFCSCKTVLENEEMVQCDKGLRCSGNRYFHLKCAKLSTKPVRGWMCPCCRSVHERQDHTFNYSCALLYEGLKDLATRDMVRENDGVGMVTSWRILMPQFWENNHFKYLIIAHKLLSDVIGFQPPRIREEITWNRTANLRGGEGHNVPLDLVNEFLNRDFKENLKRSKGQYSALNAARTSKFVGTIGRDLDNVFQSKVCGTWVSNSSKMEGDVIFGEDVTKFVRLYEADRLFEKIPGREHSSFPAFEYDLNIKNPEKLKQRLKKYARKLDLTRLIMP